MSISINFLVLFISLAFTFYSLLPILMPIAAKMKTKSRKTAKTPLIIYKKTDFLHKIRIHFPSTSPSFAHFKKTDKRATYRKENQKALFPQRKPKCSPSCLLTFCLCFPHLPAYILFCFSPCFSLHFFCFPFLRAPF